MNCCGVETILGYYDPHNTRPLGITDAEYQMYCDRNNPQRCALGDLTTKLGLLRIDSKLNIRRWNLFCYVYLLSCNFLLFFIVATVSSNSSCYNLNSSYLHVSSLSTPSPPIISSFPCLEEGGEEDVEEMKEWRWWGGWIDAEGEG